jgi:serine/threonine protein kinase
MNAEALIGTVLGTCTLQKIIGQGGMGAVFLAQQSRPRRQVAVKVLLPATALTTHQRAAFLERFRRETDAAASLEHPNILPVYEYGERDGFAYLVVPYISGGTLRDLMESEGPVPLARALNYVEQMAAALDFAHERGVIHRDVKPANILITPEGRLLLTDFGLVKIIADGQGPQARLTGAGAPVGTPDYMAPEQVIGEVVDGRSDLYSLGIILYQLLTGTTPFQGETPMQIAAKQLQTPPPSPRSLRPDVPVAAEQVMLKAMSKRPADRYTCGQDFADAFRNSLAFSGVLTNTTQAQGSTLANGSSTAARLHTPRNLFDPAWQAGTTGTMPTANMYADLAPKPTDIPPVANAEATRSGGLLSRTGMFPKVAPQTAASPGLNQPTAAFPPLTGAQSPLYQKDLLGRDTNPTGTLPTFTGAQSALLPPAIGQLPTGTGALRAAGSVDFQQDSSSRNTSGSLKVLNGGQTNTNTMKLTGPVKVVQMPVAGQPGRYVTGLLPVVSQPLAEDEKADTARRKPAKIWQKVVLALLVLLVIAGSGLSFWYIRTRMPQSTGIPATQPVGTPNPAATATALAQATVTANQVLVDPLAQNIHNLPIGTNEFFKDGTYHILNTQGNAVAVVLPTSGPSFNQAFNFPNAYTLSMWEVKGNDSSNNNSFGMILRFSQQKKNGKMVTTFYSFEVVNVAGGEYRFYKYDDSQGSPDKDWNQLWKKPFGKEFHQGQGPKKVNTIRIYQNGTNFTFTVNGKVIGTTHDSSFKSGTMGMLVNLKGTEVAFSNMLITHN